MEWDTEQTARHKMFFFYSFSFSFFFFIFWGYPAMLRVYLWLYAQESFLLGFRDHIGCGDSHARQFRTCCSISLGTYCIFLYLLIFQVGAQQLKLELDTWKVPDLPLNFTPGPIVIIIFGLGLYLAMLFLENFWLQCSGVMWFWVSNLGLPSTNICSSSWSFLCNYQLLLVNW